MKAIKRITLKNFLSESESPQPAEWIMLGFTALLCFVFFSQGGDLKATTQHGLILLSCIRGGNVMDFFYICVYNSVVPAAYSILVYLAFAIWNLPLAICFKIFTGNFDFTSPTQQITSVYWSKLMLVFLAVLSAYIIYKIAKEIGMSSLKARWVAYVFLASPTTLFVIDIFGQYDIIMLTFFLAGILFYIKDKPYHFAILLAIAIPCKFFALFAFIPLVLFIEKRVLHIIKFLAIGMSGWALTTIPFVFAPGYKETTEYFNSYGFKERIINIGIPSGFGLLSPVIFAMVFACVYAYITHIKTKEQRWQYAIYTPLYTIGLTLAFIVWHPQWWIIIVPFMALLVFNCKNFKASMFCMMGMAISHIFTSIVYFLNGVDQNMVNNGIVAHLIGYQYSNVISFQYIFNKMGLMYAQLFDAILCAFLLTLLFMWFPKRNALSLEADGNACPSKSVIYVYHLSVYIYILPTLALYFGEMLNLLPLS